MHVSLVFVNVLLAPIVSGLDGCVCAGHSSTKKPKAPAQRWLYGSHIDSKVAWLLYRTSFTLCDVVSLALMPILSEHVHVIIGSQFNTGPPSFTLPSAQDAKRRRHVWTTGSKLSVYFFVSVSSLCLVVCFGFQ